MSDEEEEEDPDANLIPNVKPGAFLGAYEVNDLAEVGISIVKDKSIDLLKEFIVTVNRADKSTGPPLANLCDFELQTPLHYACGKTGSVVESITDGSTLKKRNLPTNDTSGSDSIASRIKVLRRRINKKQKQS